VKLNENKSKNIHNIANKKQLTSTTTTKRTSTTPEKHQKCTKFSASKKLQPSLI
jgi:hypothetical protein